MVSPDQRIDPNRDVPSLRHEDKQVRRKPPTRDFRDVTEQVDERRFADEEEVEGFGLLKNSRKKSSVGRSSVAREGEHTSPPSLFELARGHRDATDDKDKEHDSKITLSTDYDIESTAVVTGHDRLTNDRLAFSKSKKDDFAAVEQPDLSTVNPLPQTPLASISASASVEAKTPVLPVRSMQEIIDQIVKEVYILEQGGKSETVIELKGAFANSHLIITEFDSAKHEMNITIDNLTAQGKALLDAHKGALVDDLQRRDIVVHMFITSAAQENRLETAQREGSRQEGGNQGFKEQERREKRNK